MNPADVQTRDWSISLTAFGELVTGPEDIAQCIRIILTTEKGSDPLRPEFGSDIYRYVDYPVNAAAALIRADIIAQVNRWEPRARITAVEVKFEGAQIIFSVFWADRRTGEDSETEIIIPAA